VPRIPWTQRSFRFDFSVELHPEIVERLRGAPARIEELVGTVPRDVLIRRDGDRWSIQENIGHLADLEELTMARVEQLMRGEQELLAADPANRKTHEANHNAPPAHDVTREFRRQREQLLARLDSLAPADFSRAAMHPRLKQSMRMIDLVWFNCEHDDYHITRMRELARKFG
jgi:hypothetical protein